MLALRRAARPMHARPFRSVAALLASMLAALLLGAGAGSQGTVTRTLVDYQVDPLGVGSATPGLSWILDHPQRGALQSAWQVRVASSPAILAGDSGDVWNSGKVLSARTTDVPYGGPPLEPERRYWWKVRFWDGADAPSPWSAPASFSIAPSTWTASHLWDGTSNANNVCYLRKRFALAAAPEQALVSVTAHDDYSLWVNGTFVGKGPAQSDPRVAQLVNTYDVAPLLGPGQNVFAVRAHWHGAGAGCGVKGEPAFLLQAAIRLPGGGLLRVASDATWKVLAQTPWDESAPFRGPALAKATAVEWYDGRAEVTGWRSVAFNDGPWPQASVVHPAHVLEAQRFPLERTVADLAPVSIAEHTPGVFLVDFGQNSTGWPILDVHGAAAGTEINLYYSEALDSSGRAIVRDRDGVTHSYDRYTCRGGASETFEPDIKYLGFRWVEVEGYPGVLTPLDIRLRYVRGALDVVDDFRSSSPLLDAIYALSVRTQLNAVQGVLIDCPQREQSQYLSDLVFQGLNLSHNVRDFGLLRKPLADFSKTALLGSILLANSPAEQIQVVPEWSLHMPLAVWLEYWLYDDMDVLADTYAVLRGNIAAFELFRDPTTNLLTNVPGNVSISDWPCANVDMDCPALTPQNCLYYGALTTTADIAELLGQPGDAAQYRALAALVREGINTWLFDGLDRYSDCLGSSEESQVVSVFALYFGLVPPGSVDDVLAFVKSKGFDSQVYGGWYLTELYYRHGEGRFLFDLIHQTHRLWGFMLAQGATTAWEGWNDTYSLSHAWTAYPMKFLKSGLLGVTPSAPGYGSFRVRPQLPALDLAEGTLPTVRGDVFVRATRSGASALLEVRVPANTTAEIDVPKLVSASPTIRESGVLVWDGWLAAPVTPGAPGVTALGEEPGYVRFAVGAGSYAFEQVAPSVRPLGQPALGPPPVPR